jgi:tol-pal system protein YbgF
MKYKVVYFLPMLLLCGCMATTSQSSIDDLKKEVSKLQIKCTSLETKQVELYSKFEENLVNGDTASASIQELYKKITQLSQELKDLEVSVNNQKKDNASNLNTQVPSKLYESAYNDFLLGKYEISMNEFKSFLKQYKDHNLAAQAQYYIAESLYAQSKFEDAYEEYKKIEQLYTDSELIPSSRLKMALCLELLNKKEDSIIVLQSIIEKFPKSAEAFTAKEKIKIYTNDKNK